MYTSKVDVPENTRKVVIELLSAQLADAIDLATQAKQAHWNVKGSDFIALHELFDQVYGVVTGHVDLLAERIVMLGGITKGTARAVASRSRLAEYPLDAVAASDHVAALSAALTHFASTTRKAINEADEVGDLVTADLLTQIAGEVDKQAWFVSAHAA
jgi:starvation-inducible DNA-binding protein